MFFSACQSKKESIRCLITENKQNNAITSNRATLNFFVDSNQLCFYSPGNSRNRFATLIKNQQPPVPTYKVEFKECTLDENDTFNSVPRYIASTNLSLLPPFDNSIEVQSNSYRHHIDSTAVPKIYYRSICFNPLLFEHPTRSRHIRAVACYDHDIIVALDYRSGLELRILPNATSKITSLFNELNLKEDHHRAMDVVLSHSKLNGLF